MSVLSSSILPIATVLAVVASASLVFAAEGIRGAGRVVYGLSFLALAYYFGFVETPAPYLVAGGFVLSGVVTVGFGVRKYMRR